MICPKCEYEYVEGTTVCADCGSELIANEEFTGHVTTPEDWIILQTFSESYEAEMLRDNLESADIETLIWSQKDSNFPTAGDLSIIKLMVKKSDATDAIAILEDINSYEDEEEDEEE